MFQRRLRTAPFRRRITRYYSVLDPLPKLVDQLNAFQPAFLGTYASVLAALTAEQEAGRLRISPLVITSGVSCCRRPCNAGPSRHSAAW